MLQIERANCITSGALPPRAGFIGNMEVSEKGGSPQSQPVEARKRRREDEEETEHAQPEGDAANHQPKRLRTENGGSADAESDEALKKGKDGPADDSSSEEGEIDEGVGASAADKAEEGEVLSSEGEVMDSSDEGSSDGEKAKTASPHPSPSSSKPRHSGWNKGISVGQVQTSLSSLTQKATPPTPVVAAPRPPSKEKSPSKENSPREKSPSPAAEQPPSTEPSNFQQSGISLRLPPAADRNPGESWQLRFQEWTNALVDLNSEQVSKLTPELVLDAYNHFIDQVCAIHNRKKRAAKAGADLFSVKGALSDTLDSARGSGSGTPPTKEQANRKMSQTNGTEGNGPSQAAQAQSEARAPDMPTAADWERALESKPATRTPGGEGEGKPNGASSDKPSQTKPKQNGSSHMPPPPYPPVPMPTGDEESRQQRKYFPRSSARDDMCILCLQPGHKALSCPTLDCEHCGAKYQHSSYACPLMCRCAKCKGLVHTAGACTEGQVNLRKPAADCAHCGASDHPEKDCDSLWRTFREPDPTTKCQFIYAFCASCGEEGHYFSDCREGCHSKSRVWCQETLDRHLDKASKRDPICDVKPRPSTSGLRRPELVGRSNDNIYFESDDSDADAPFLGDRVQKPPVGRINVSSNIRFVGQASASHDPGVPPPSTLPPRPQPYSDTIRSEARGQDGGRRQQHQLPPRPPAPRRGGGGNYQAVPPPPGLQRSHSQGSNGKPGRGGKSRGSGRGGRGGSGRGNGRGGGSRGRGGKW